MNPESRSIIILMCFSIGFCFLNSLRLNQKELSDSFIEDRCETTDLEELFACNKPIAFEKASQIEFESLPGVSSVTAEKIVKGKDKILSKSISLPPESKPLALTIIKGIGIKKAAKIGKYLRLP